MSKRRQVRVSVSLEGATLEKVGQIMVHGGLPNLGATVRYLMTKGIETMGPGLAARELIERLERKLSPQELMTFAMKTEREAREE